MNDQDYIRDARGYRPARTDEMITLLVPEYNMKMNQMEAIALYKLVTAVTESDCHAFGLTDSQEKTIQEIFTKLDEAVGNAPARERQEN